MPTYLSHYFHLFLQELVSRAGQIQQEEWHVGLENMVGFFLIFGNVFKLSQGVALPLKCVSPYLLY